MKIYTVFRIVALLLLVFVSVFSITTYRKIQVGIPITYSILSVEEKNWRGSSYVLHVLFNEEVYKANVSTADYALVQNGEKPKLYYNSLYNQVVTSKTLQLSIGVSMGLLLLLLLVEWQLRKKRQSLA